MLIEYLGTLNGASRVEGWSKRTWKAGQEHKKTKRVTKNNAINTGSKASKGKKIT